MAELVAFREDRLGFRFRLLEKITLGRAPECNLILFDRSASRKHAEIVQINENYFINDLDSTNGTLVNDQPITMQTKLQTFDCIKIGQEIFIFDPYLDVIGGPAPAALILNSVNEPHENQIVFPASEAALAITQEQSALLMKFSNTLCTSDIQDIPDAINNFLANTLGATSISILWPSNNTALNQISFLSYPEDKRLLLSQTPFKRVTSMSEALVWPTIITELDFNSGNRHIGNVEQPCILAPLYDPSNKKLGLIYVENSNRNLLETDLNFLAATGQIISPFLYNLINQHEIEKDKQLVVTEFDPLSDIASRDQQLKIVFSTASHVAQNEAPIHISGEIGTGQTSLAHYIHLQSPKKNGRFVTATLSDIPPAQLDQLLFGQENSKEDTSLGLIALADNGTIFLRHIEYLTMTAQRSILMALEEGLIYPIGSRHSRPVSTRIISSTSTDLREKVENGSFREDLYSRLTHVNLSLPPIRETKGDIESLTIQFASRAARNLGIPFSGIDPAASECLRAYPWPGNITELRAEAHLMAFFSRNGRISMEDLPVYLRLAPEVFSHGDIPADELLIEAESHFIARALACHNGDVEAASKILSLSPEEVIIKARAFGLDPMDYQAQVLSTRPRGPGQTSLPSDED